MFWIERVTWKSMRSLKLSLYCSNNIILPSNWDRDACRKTPKIEVLYSESVGVDSGLIVNIRVGDVWVVWRINMTYSCIKVIVAFFLWGSGDALLLGFVISRHALERPLFYYQRLIEIRAWINVRTSTNHVGYNYSSMLLPQRRWS